MLHIMVVEDSEDDIALLERRLKSLSYEFELHIFRGVKPAVEYLMQLQTASSQAGRSVNDHLLLLDLGLQGEHGFEVLSFVKQCPGLQDLPVFIVSASDNKEEIRNSYRYGGCIFIRKPLQVEALNTAVQQLVLTGRISIR